MGGDQSQIKDHQAGEMFQVELTETERANYQNSKNKPSALYAKLASQSPTLLSVVSKVKDRYKSELGFTKQEEHSTILPLFQIIDAPTIYYRGQWLNGRQHGKGEVYSKNGLYFIGKFKSGSAECDNGLLVFPDGSFYKGAFKQNKLQGQGYFFYANNEMEYKGSWHENKPDGYGVQSYKDGSKYEGQFEKGKKSGQGTFTWADGKVYKGEFRQGLMDGRGTLTKKNSNFDGTFVKGQKSRGSLKTAYGQYEGEFQYGEMHAEHAKFTWDDGKKYVGGFQFGQLHGDGKITMPNKVEIHGRWQHGESVQVYSISEKQI